MLASPNLKASNRLKCTYDKANICVEYVYLNGNVLLEYICSKGWYLT